MAMNVAQGWMANSPLPVPGNVAASAHVVPHGK